MAIDFDYHACVPFATSQGNFIYTTRPLRNKHGQYAGFNINVYYPTNLDLFWLNKIFPVSWQDLSSRKNCVDDIGQSCVKKAWLFTTGPSKNFGAMSTTWMRYVCLFEVTAVGESISITKELQVLCRKHQEKLLLQSISKVLEGRCRQIGCEIKENDLLF